MLLLEISKTAVEGKGYLTSFLVYLYFALAVLLFTLEITHIFYPSVTYVFRSTSVLNQTRINEVRYRGSRESHQQEYQEDNSIFDSESLQHVTESNESQRIWHCLNSSTGGSDHLPNIKIHCL
ncbi:hypothetical protein SK128_003926 [Halocaridina rubra]|uniref:Uncharacterized protein n=1 Tax=Halocaridina rubra TaxID=373956 RepID=A0AAN9A1B3_HALRR